MPSGEYADRYNHLVGVVLYVITLVIVIRLLQPQPEWLLGVGGR
ncbi:hypothetical protein [Microbispora amethystogenes]|uniref:Uncharacterized protein n=1 Tax=Microbispora amethystogenes TaxID=1427754 RepID=A0ABQ4FLH8_9ACTN|nr:hypothetical protein [Microbispora amethystogenes]GIH35670.1 hypothetical protein Mam01_58340 [Microbispora amethystogenes]